MFCLPEQVVLYPLCSNGSIYIKFSKRLQTWTTLIPHGNYSLDLLNRYHWSAWEKAWFFWSSYKASCGCCEGPSNSSQGAFLGENKSLWRGCEASLGQTIALSNLSACALTKLGSGVRRMVNNAKCSGGNTSAASPLKHGRRKWAALGLRARGWSNACLPAGKEPWERYSGNITLG